ncbi:hypothetical protein WG66_003104 [Moniliophthora roreri]|nr:hypothetical protein WG66_003104 [Moniliophthora roreri]
MPNVDQIQPKNPVSKKAFGLLFSAIQLSVGPPTPTPSLNPYCLTTTLGWEPRDYCHFRVRVSGLFEKMDSYLQSDPDGPLRQVTHVEFLRTRGRLDVIMFEESRSDWLLYDSGCLLISTKGRFLSCSSYSSFRMEMKIYIHQEPLTRLYCPIQVAYELNDTGRTQRNSTHNRHNGYDQIWAVYLCVPSIAEMKAISLLWIRANKLLPVKADISTSNDVPPWRSHWFELLMRRVDSSETSLDDSRTRVKFNLKSETERLKSSCLSLIFDWPKRLQELHQLVNSTLDHLLSDASPRVQDLYDSLLIKQQITDI